MEGYFASIYSVLLGHEGGVILHESPNVIFTKVGKKFGQNFENLNTLLTESQNQTFAPANFKVRNLENRKSENFSSQFVSVIVISYVPFNVVYNEGVIP